MLRSFLRESCTPERAVSLIKLLDLLEHHGYIDQLLPCEQLIASGIEGCADDIRSQLETIIAGIVESIYRLHHIDAYYEFDEIDEITRHLNFVMTLHAPEGYQVPVDNEHELFEFGEDGLEILANLYDESGHNINRIVCHWVEGVRLLFTTNLLNKIAVAKKAAEEFDDVKVATGDQLDRIKRYYAIYPGSIAVQHFNKTGGILRPLMDILNHFAEALFKSSPQQLAEEIIGIALVSENFSERFDATSLVKEIESIVGEGSRAVETVRELKRVIDKAGLK